jgi:hypothetical protein
VPRRFNPLRICPFLMKLEKRASYQSKSDASRLAALAWENLGSRFDSHGRVKHWYPRRALASSIIPHRYGIGRTSPQPLGARTFSLFHYGCGVSEKRETRMSLRRIIVASPFPRLRNVYRSPMFDHCRFLPRSVPAMTATFRLGGEHLSKEKSRQRLSRKVRRRNHDD